MTDRRTKHEVPGFFIKQELVARGWAQADLAFVLDMQPQQLSSILAGKHAITADVAVALGDALGVPAEVFSNLQKNYELANAGPGNPAIKKRGIWQTKYPLREMISRGWIEDADADMLDAQLMRFFGVNTIEAVAGVNHAAKKSASYDVVTHEQLAWLHRVRQMARSIDAARFSTEGLRVATHNMVGYRTSPDDVGGICKLLTEAGVRFVVVETIQGSKIDGVCTWLSDDKPVVAISNRLDRFDNFMFVLRHELEHVMRGHGREAPAFDNEQTLSADAIEIEERQANDAAADFCVPKSQMSSFIARKGSFVSEADILGLAKRLGVHPSIVIGQYQFTTKKWSFLRKYLASSVCGVRKHLIASLDGTNALDGWDHVANVAL